MRINKPELLAPAGNMEKLKIALIYGADAAYLGGKLFSLRALGGNFTNEELKEAVDFAHNLGKKIYVAINIFPHNSDINALPEYIKYLNSIKVDAVLVADLGLFMMCRELAPELPLHISTQANNTNWRTVKSWADLGASRVVLARELSRDEIVEIRKHTNVELEQFIHGAMCISYSGRCLLSSYFTGRDSNRGVCAQSCRWKYFLVEENREGQYFPIEEDERGTYIMNSKDLCLMPYLHDIISIGVDSLKIEGRMKSVHYVASVVKAYRMAIDGYITEPDNYTISNDLIEELNKVSHRAYTTGFYTGNTSAENQIYGTSSYEQMSDFVGLVRHYDEKTKIATVEQRNNIKAGQEIEVFPPTGKAYKQIIKAMHDDNGVPIDVAPHPQQIITMKLDYPVEPYTILRRDIIV